MPVIMSYIFKVVIMSYQNGVFFVNVFVIFGPETALRICPEQH